MDPFHAVLPEKTITSKKVFQKMRETAAVLPDMTLDEINENTRQTRAARKVLLN